MKRKKHIQQIAPYLRSFALRGLGADFTKDAAEVAALVEEGTADYQSATFHPDQQRLKLHPGR